MTVMATHHRIFLCKILVYNAVQFLSLFVTSRTLIALQVNSSLAFFLFSFQVHEKSILLVAL